MPKNNRVLARPREPLRIERYYVRNMRLIWRKVEEVILIGLQKLYNVWPSEFRNDISVEDKEAMLAHMRQLAEDLPPPPGPPGYRGRPVTGATMHPPRIRAVDPLHTMPPPPIISVLNQRSVDQVLAWIDDASSYALSIDYVIPVIDKVFQQASDFVAADLTRIVRIPIRSMIDLTLLETFRNANIDLIESGIWADRLVPQLRARALLPQVNKTVQDAFTGGLRVEVLREQIMERFDVGRSRADLIARDQTLKLNGQINRNRQKEIGIDRYEWSTSRDSRVRKTHKHDGKIFSWDDPPDPPGVHPGQDYQCRCIAIPVAPDWLDE
jgi:SPP1 gp7 family putative phage head morphogenesis protein